MSIYTYPTGRILSGILIGIANSVVIPYKKAKCKLKNFDESYNLSSCELFFYKRSGTIIATFVRVRKTRTAESGGFP